MGQALNVLQKTIVFILYATLVATNLALRAINTVAPIVNKAIKAISPKLATIITKGISYATKAVDMSIVGADKTLNNVVKETPLGLYEKQIKAQDALVEKSTEKNLKEIQKVEAQKREKKLTTSNKILENEASKTATRSRKLGHDELGKKREVPSTSTKNIMTSKNQKEKGLAM